MKVIIPLAGFGTRMRPHSWSRPKALLHVAGNTVLGHILEQIKVLTVDEVVLIVGYKGAEIKAWVAEAYPHLAFHFVVQEQPLGQAHALWLCRDFLDDGAVFMTFGDGIIDAAYEDISQTEADGVALVQTVADPRKFGVAVLNDAGQVARIVEKPDSMTHKLALAGGYWFKNGRQLQQALDQVIQKERKTKGEYYLADALNLMLENGFKLETQATNFWFDTGTPENILHTNMRLLGLGYGSEDIIDRSYGEDFTVTPPVFVHETAVVDHCVIGPYVSIGPNVTLRRCVVSHAIIDAHSTVTDVHLQHSLIGENATVKGNVHSLFVGDNSKVELG